MLVPVQDPSTGQIDVFEKDFYLIGIFLGEISKKNSKNNNNKN